MGRGRRGLVVWVVGVEVGGWADGEERRELGGNGRG